MSYRKIYLVFNAPREREREREGGGGGILYYTRIKRREREMTKWRTQTFYHDSIPKSDKIFMPGKALFIVRQIKTSLQLPVQPVVNGYSNPADWGSVHV